MTKAARAEVASSFTVVKGALINETYQVLAAWDLSRSKKENLDRLREENFIGARSNAWLRDIAWVLNRRFDPAGRDRALVLLAQGGCDLDEWKPLLLWHLTRDEFLVRDFLQHFLFPAYQAGALRARREEVLSYLQGISRRRSASVDGWTERTKTRVAAGLLKIAADFGLLQGRAVKTFCSYHLPEKSFLYILHAIRDEQKNPGKVIHSADWRLFLQDAEDVEQEILRLHQFRKLHYEVAGSLMQLTLPAPSAYAFAERWFS